MIQVGKKYTYVNPKIPSVHGATVVVIGPTDTGEWKVATPGGEKLFTARAEQLRDQDLKQGASDMHHGKGKGKRRGHNKHIVSGHSGEGHHAAHRRYYQHLCWHPSYHKAASAAAKRITSGDKTTKDALADLVQRGKAGDIAAANAAMAIAVCCKFECQDGGVISGAIPGVVSVASKLVKLVLTPAAWTAGILGRTARWTGNQLQHVAHAL